ncbi:TPA: fumarate hydratase [Candidatus Bathyarchaeota archaeon]|nr:fumarate hydratase [Candidatus Bathyarchaeota archaeon]
MELENVIKETASRLLELAATRVPKDVEEALRRALRGEKGEVARVQLQNMLRNIELARKTNRPICEDTGLIAFLVRAGDGFPSLGRVPGLLAEATRRATRRVPLRPNAIDAITGLNTGNNVGALAPTIEWEVVEGDYMELTAFPKGGGSENMSRLFMLRPADGLMKLDSIVIDSVVEAGAQPCPPIILGIGIAGEGATAMGLARRAVLRDVGARSPNPMVARLEDELLRRVNQTGIGPMGLGGKTTALDVHVEYACRHPATFAVGIVFQCYLARKASARISSDGDVTYLTEFVSGP